jgi:hypothetical protein
MSKQGNAIQEQGPKPEKRDIHDAINEFYKMKDKYETAYKEKYINPLVKAKNTSQKEKRVAFSKLPKPECVNCKRNVGTVFSIKTNSSEFARKYIAKCGDANEPCPLNINLVKGTHFTFETEINQNADYIDDYKRKIIKEKYNMMFGYVAEETAIGNFEQLSIELKEMTNLAGDIIEKNILVNDNPEKSELLKRSIDIFGKEYILQFKRMMKEYDESGNEQLANEAVKFYKNEMLPRIKEIQELKYEINMVEYDTEELTFLLRQRKNSLQSLEYTFSKDDKVLAFVKGTSTPSKNKTLKVKPISKSKSKTRRAYILVEEGEEEGEGEEKIEQPEEEEYVPQSPEYNPASPEYNPASPEYNPVSPEYNPVSPEYNPVSPEYNPVSPPVNNSPSSGNTSSSSGYVPNSPEYKPLSPS